MADISGSEDIDIRSIRPSDIDFVLDLWGMAALEQTGPPLSYDRWGPGVSVPFEKPLQNASEMPSEPAVAIRKLLEAAVHGSSSYCFVAEQCGILKGFLLARCMTHPDSPGVLGIFEELFVRPDQRRCRIGTRLVNFAAGTLHSRGVSVLRAEVPSDLEIAKVFWASMKWEHDLDIWSIYL